MEANMNCQNLKQVNDLLLNWNILQLNLDKKSNVDLMVQLDTLAYLDSIIC